MVTGSVGKTTMIHMLEVALGSDAHVSHGANSSFGIAFDVVGEKGVKDSRLRWLYLLIAVPIKSVFFTRRASYYVAEVDADRPLEAELVARWLGPETSFWISSSNSHAVNFQELAATRDISIEQAVAESFAGAVAHTRASVFYNADEPVIEEAISSLGVAAVPIRRVGGYKVTERTTGFRDKAGRKFLFSEPLPEEVGLQLAMVNAYLESAGMEITTDYSAMTQPPGRSTYLSGKGGFGIIDSSYNAHLESTASMLKMFKKIKHTSKWLVIADIIEQGNNEEKEHKRLAQEIAKTGALQVILVGQRTADHTMPELAKLGIGAKSFTSHKEALDYLSSNLMPKDLVLFKGSQFLEGLIENLLEDPSDADRLCRRDAKSQAARTARGIL